MARKDPSQWTEAYRKRIERALAQGKSKQAARGHKAKEHVTRAERKRAAGKITEREKAIIRRWAKNVHRRMPGFERSRFSVRDIYNLAYKDGTLRDWRKFEKVHARLKELEKAGRKKGREREPLRWLEDIAYDLNVESFWLYYHRS